MACSGAPAVAVRPPAGDDAALHQLHGALVLPHQGLNAQLHVHFALDAIVGLDAREAVVVGADDGPGLRAVLPGLLGRSISMTSRMMSIVVAASWSMRRSSMVVAGRRHGAAARSMRRSSSPPVAREAACRTM